MVAISALERAYEHGFAGQCRRTGNDALLKVLSSPWLAAQLGSLPGHDPGRCGEHVATL